MNTIEIYSHLDPQQFGNLAKTITNQIIIIKLGAEWCGPCKKSKPQVNEWFQKIMTENKGKFLIFDLDVDESMELYGFFKKQKMVNGIPVILAYYPIKNSEKTKIFIPDDSYTGSDPSLIDELFSRIINYSKSLK